MIAQGSSLLIRPYPTTSRSRMRSSFRRQFAEVHGADFEVVQSVAAPRPGGLPLHGWPVWARFIVLAPIAAALLILAGLLAFVAIGLAWMMGAALFGDVVGKVIAGFVALLVVCALLVGFNGLARPNT